MATSPSPPNLYYPQVDPKISSNIRTHLQLLYTATNDSQGAIVALKSQLDDLTTTVSTTKSTNTTTTVVENQLSGLGTVSNQEGVTAYTVLASDNGALLLISDASAVAVTLDTTLAVPYMLFVANLGAGTTTLTPSSGQINGGSAFTMLQNYFSVIVSDGTNWWASALPVVPVNTTATAHQFFTAYNSSTGAFTKAQPAFTDISGSVAPAQLPTPTLTTIGGVEANNPVTHEWINAINTSGVPQLSQPAFSDVSGNLTTGQLPTAGLSVTITTAALTALGTQGSMTFTNGILTSSTPAT